MNRPFWLNCLILLTCALCSLSTVSPSTGAALELPQGAHVCIVGNTLADRMQHDGYFEATLQHDFPVHELVIRNLGFSGDELTTRLRSSGFGSPDEHLTRQKADVVFAFFGYNESFAGAEGLPAFRQTLREYVQHLRSTNFNGQSPPQVVLVSPIAHENLKSRILPDGSANNARLELYTAAMADVAKEMEIPIVDLFHATQKLYNTATPLTINGIHLNDAGNRHVARLIQQALWPTHAEINWSDPQAAKLREAVKEKNFYWFNRYRTTDGYSIYGGRADLTFTDGQTNRVVMQREMEILDALTALRDHKIWAAANGKEFVPNDDSTPAFIPVVTNKPGEGPGGAHLFLSGEDSIQKMTVASNMDVSLFASEEQFPELINPVQMAFDTRGRLWVSAWESYPHWKPKEEMNDKLLILEDTDGDGRADRCQTFAGGLHNPTGFEFYGGGVIVAMAPDLVYLQDTDGDDVADVRERVLNGICSADTHHTANSFVLDPGGGLYFQEGTFHHTQVETPYGPSVRSANAGVYRFEPNTFKFDVYVAYGFANPHGHVFDRWGQDFIHDGTGAVPYHGTLFSGHLDFPAKHSAPPTLYNQRTRPCPATEIVSGNHFPPEMQGNLLVGNVIGFQGILQYRLQDRGASFLGEEVEPILYSTDPNFRPVDLEMAPDGSLYFTDWQNPIIGHMQHNLRDPSRDRKHGRVYRVTYRGRAVDESPAIAEQPIESVISLLAHPSDRVRYRAKIELSSRPSDVVLSSAMKWLASLNASDTEYEHHRLEVLWLYQYHSRPNRELLERVLQSPDFHARAAAVRVASHWRDDVTATLAVLKRVAADEHPRVRLEAVRAASFLPLAEAVEVPLITTELPSDEYIEYTRNETMRALEPYWRGAVERGEPIAVTSEVGMRWLLQRVRVDELVKMPRSSAVYQELLNRDDVPETYRREAIEAIAKQSHGTPLQVLIDALQRLDQEATPRSAVFDLGRLLANWDREPLQAGHALLEDFARNAKTPSLRQLGYVSLMMADRNTAATWNLASESVPTLKDLVASVSMVPDLLVQEELATRIEPLFEDLPASLKKSLGDRQFAKGTYGRYVRIDLPGRRRTLTLAEVQVFSDGRNVARTGTATQSATAYGGTADRAIDGNTNSSYGSGTQTHTPENSRDPWWEVDLGDEFPIDKLAIFNREDGSLGRRLDGFTLTVFDGSRSEVFKRETIPAPDPSMEILLEAGGPQGVIRRAAIEAMVYVRGREVATFERLADYVARNEDRSTAVRALLRIPTREWPVDRIHGLLDSLLAYLKQLSVDDRRSATAGDALQLADALASRLPPDEAQRIRRQLRELGVRRLRLGTVPHRMVYDQERLVVEAGKQVELLFENLDIMPHNFVITQPGALEEVGLLAEATGQQPGAFQRHFVPESDKILVSSELLQPRENQKLVFNAPTKAGIYPYVCTYPGHWRRMFGSLVVVDNLDDFESGEETYLASHQIIAIDEMLKMIRPSRAWQFSDLEPALADLEEGRSFTAGKRMFQLATCISCHRLNGEGNEFGPDLAKYDPMWKPGQLLKHMVEPSFEINKQFQTQTLELTSGQVITGLVVGLDATVLKIVENPLISIEPRTIQRSEIETQVVSPKSIMPEGLLDRLTREEILDLLAYIYARGDQHHAVYHGDQHAHHH